ncbi:MAG: ATP-binding protein [Bacteroidales bacterium]|jgi:hypothetical protein|nr:ATP-binding protein [Bacteroidales bacterium]
MKDLSLHILDISDNSLRANSQNVSFTIIIDDDGILSLTIKDDGKGMEPEMVKQVLNPFFSTRTNRKIGLGLPLLKQNAEKSGGSFNIESELGKGTTVTAKFNTKNIDCIPLGDIAGVMTIIFTSNPTKNIEFEYKKAENQFFLNTFALVNIFGDENLQDVWIQKELKQFINNNIK